MTDDTRKSIECPACEGDGRIPDKTGGGHHGTCVICRGSGRIPSGYDCDTCPEPEAYGFDERSDRYLACASCLEGCIIGGSQS